MPYLAEPSPQAVQTTALLLYAVAFRARSDAGLRIPRQNLWNLADSYPGVAEAVGGRLGFYAAIRALAGTYPHLVQVVTSTGRRTDVVLFRDLTIGARGYGIYGLGH